MFWAVSLLTTKLIPRRLSAALGLAGIRSSADIGTRTAPAAIWSLYPRKGTRDAAPKCISERTSYHGT